MNGEMCLQPGIIEVDIHGLNTYQAKIAIESQLKRAGKGTYRLRVIHGYHQGSALQTLVRKEFKNHPKVLRVEVGLNQGQTDLVLREY